MQERKNIELIIKNILADELDIDIIRIKAESRLKEDLSLDSLAIIRLVFSLNNQFNIEIQSSEINQDNFSTIENLDNFIFKKLPATY
jgi:acyl carrier protein